MAATIVELKIVLQIDCLCQVYAADSELLSVMEVTDVARGSSRASEVRIRRRSEEKRENTPTTLLQKQ